MLFKDKCVTNLDVRTLYLMKTQLIIVLSLTNDTWYNVHAQYASFVTLHDFHTALTV